MNKDILLIDIPSDFYENTNKCILITGAGFSKDLGAYLAEELAPKIFNIEDMPKDLRKIVGDNKFDYELAFDKATGKYAKIFENALSEIFKKIDKEITSGISENSHHRLLKLLQSRDKYNFIVTLNQDLAVERFHLLMSEGNIENKPGQPKETIEKTIGLNFPFTNYFMADVVGSKWNGNFCIQRQRDYNFENFQQVIKYSRENILKIGQTNYIKLHGSANWSHSEGKNVLISGVKKERKIHAYNVLRANFSLFEKLSEIPKLRIVIVGYGFKDTHVNNIISKAIENGAELAIIQPTKQKDFYDNTLNACSEKLKYSITKYFNKPLKELNNEEFKELESWLKKID